MKNLFEDYINFHVSWNIVFKNLVIGLGFYFWYLIVKALTDQSILRYKTNTKIIGPKNSILFFSFFGDIFWQTLLAIFFSIRIIDADYLNLMIPLLIISFSLTFYKFFFVLNKVSQNVIKGIILWIVISAIASFLIIMLFYLLKWEINFLYVFLLVFLFTIIFFRKDFKND